MGLRSRGEVAVGSVQIQRTLEVPEKEAPPAPKGNNVSSGTIFF